MTCRVMSRAASWGFHSTYPSAMDDWRWERGKAFISMSIGALSCRLGFHTLVDQSLAYFQLFLFCSFIDCIHFTGTKEAGAVVILATLSSRCKVEARPERE